MPKGLMAKLAGVQESTGEFADIEPGLYKLVITNVEPHEKQEFVRIFWDVAEGPSKGTYAQSQYPPSEVMSWKETGQGMLKHKLHVLSDSNDGYKASATFENDTWKDLVGKTFGAVVRRRLYTAGPNSKNPGADRETVEIAKWLMPDEFAEGKFSERLLQPRDQRDKKGEEPQAQANVPDSFQPQDDFADEDIPF